MLSSQSDESNKDEKPKDTPVNSKICPICDEKLEAKTDKELSQKLADHIQENHPEPIKKPEPIQDPELPNKKKPKFSTECHHCGEIVETDSEQKTKELMQVHILSHDTKVETKSTDSNVMLYAGFTFLLIVAGIIVGILYIQSRKKFDKEAGK